MVLLEWSELMSHSFPSSSENGESDIGEPLSFGLKGWRTKRGMRLRGLPFSGDFFSCSKQHQHEATHLHSVHLLFLGWHIFKRLDFVQIVGPAIFFIALLLKNSIQHTETSD